MEIYDDCATSREIFQSIIQKSMRNYSESLRSSDSPSTLPSLNKTYPFFSESSFIDTYVFENLSSINAAAQ